LLVLVLSVGSILCFVILTNNHQWIVQYYEVFSNANWTKVFYSLHDKSFSGFATLNALSRDRLELHGAALRMGWAYPFFGIGLGDFFRLSAIIEFSGSPFMVRLGGENAHNYFFQTFAEVGFLGIFCFSLIFLVPVFKCSQRERLVPVAIAILSIFAGNVYSHSLIIKENLFLLTCLLALLIAHQSESTRIHYFERIKDSRLKVTALFCVISAVIFFSLKEIDGSFYKIPFNLVR
jgi:O-antigen ligase